MNKKYEIQEDYIIRETPMHFDDSKYKDEYQDEVYEFAKTFKFTF